MARRLGRELSEFPFRKLNPPDFAVRLTGMAEPELHEPLRVWVETTNISRVVSLCGYVKVLMACPWIDFVLLETTGRDLGRLTASDLVRSVWNDSPLKSEGCAVPSTNPRSITLAVRATR